VVAAEKIQIKRYKKLCRSSKPPAFLQLRAAHNRFCQGLKNDAWNNPNADRRTRYTMVAQR
jgi:hypothetical protein